MRGYRICSRAGRVSANVTGTHRIYFLFKRCCRSCFFRTEVSSGQTSVLDNLFYFCRKFSGLYAGINSINVILQFGVNRGKVLVERFNITELLVAGFIQMIVRCLLLPAAPPP